MKSIFKKVSAAVMALAVAATVFVFNVPGKIAAAEIVQSGSCSDNITWTLDADGVLTISGTGAMPNYGSTSTPWNDLKDQIKSVAIENGVTSIGSYAFYQCTSLTSATLPDSVTTAGRYSFANCGKLAEVKLSNKLTTLPQRMFDNCSALKSITIPGGVTNIEKDVFRDCRSLTSLTIPSSVQEIGEDFVYNCSSLTTVVIENGLTSLGLRTFYKCSALTSITLPESLTTIGGGVFNDCTSLRNITIPENVTLIGNSAFINCKALKNITIPKSVTSIGKEVFKGCTLNEVRFEGETPPTFPAKSDLCTATSIEKITVPCTAVDQYKTADGFSNCADKISGKHTLTKTEAKSPTCTENGNKEYWYCSQCKKYFSDSACTTEITQASTVVSKTGHTWNTEWTKSDTQHWHACLTSGCTEKSDTANHDFVQKSDGTNHWQQCSACGYKKDKTAHSWGDWSLTTLPDLTTTGTAERVCSCSEKDTKTDVPALTDSTVWTKGDRTDPTLNGTGSQKYTSTDYGTVTITIPALTDSTWKIDNTQHVDATEETDGKDVYKSNVYGEVTVVIPALDHTHEWGDWEITKAPTSETEGTAKHVCTKNDRHTETKTLAVLTDTSVWTKVNDKHVDPTEQTEGKDVYTSEYGEVTVTIPKLNHTHTLTHVPEVPATETQTGVKEHWHCDGCNKDFEDENGTKEVTQEDLKTGKLKTKVEAPTNVPKPEIATSEENLIEVALTKDEQKELKKGTDITIILKVEDASQTVHPDDKGKVETAIGDLSNNKLGQYLDVTLLKKIGDREEQVTATNSPIKITFEIPESLRGKAEYSVIRVHGGTATILRDLDSDPNTVTIETDKFSTYALTYKEKTATSTPSGTTGGSSGSSGFNWSDYSNTAFDESTSSEDNSFDTASNASNVNNGSAAAPSGNENSSDGDNSSDTAPNGNENSSDGDNSSDTAPSGNENPSDGDNNSNSNRLKIVSSGASSNDRSSKNPNESSSSENNGNPSTGFAVSLIPITATLAVVLIAAKRRRK